MFHLLQVAYKLRYCLIYMDRFLKPPSSSPPPSPKRPAVEAKQGCITAARAIEFGKANFYADGGKLVCKSCNVVVDHIGKDTIDKHIKSKKRVAKALTISLDQKSVKTEPREYRLSKL